jgi:hypothetical protein
MGTRETRVRNFDLNRWIKERSGSLHPVELQEVFFFCLLVCL